MSNVSSKLSNVSPNVECEFECRMRVRMSNVRPNVECKCPNVECESECRM